MAKFIEKLKVRWGIQGTWHVILILVVFAITGTSVLVIKPFLFDLLSITESDRTIWFNILYLILILPIYNLLLLFWGFVFGQFRFFFEFEKRFFKRMFGKGKKS